MHTDSNQVIKSSQTDQIDSVCSTSSPNCGNLVISEGDESASQAVSLNSVVSTKCTVLLATRVNALGPNGTKIQVRALIDPGSQISLVTQALCNLLSLNCRTSHTHIQGIGEKTAAVSFKVARLTIQPHYNSTFSLEVDGIILPKLSSCRPPVVGAISNFEYLRGLQLADPMYLEALRIDILLGASAYAQIIENQIVKGQNLQPIALSSKLGWLLTGNLSSSPSEIGLESISLHCSNSCDHEAKLLELVQDFWRAEEIASKNLTRLTNKHARIFIKILLVKIKQGNI